MESTLLQKLDTYQPSPSTIELIKSTPILLLVGPSGSGKSALKDGLLAAGGYHHIVSHTTRSPRVNHGVQERDGREYHFIDETQAAQLLNEQAFVEAKIFSDNLYGTSVAEIQAAHDAHQIALADIEVQGVAEYKAIDPNIMAIFLLPPDFETWRNRLRQRNNVVDEKDMRRRLETALAEIKELLSTDYYIAVVNADLDGTFEEVQAIVQDKSRGTATESKARMVAQQLTKAIRDYLATNV